MHADSDPAQPNLSSGLTPLGPRASVRSDNLRFTFSRSSGPGGQNVNKVNTRAELRVSVVDLRGLDEGARLRLRALAGRRLTADDQIVLASDEHRSQRANKETCLDRLRELVLQALVVPRRRRKTKPSRASRERRLEGKRRESEKKSQRRSNRRAGGES